MKTTFIGKDQDMQNETTRYWFEISDHDYIDAGQYAVCDCCGERSFLDSDGALVDQRFVIHLEKIEITEEMIQAF